MEGDKPMRDDNFFNNNNNNNENDINNSNNTNQEMNNNNSINNEVNTNETIIIEENGNPISENEVNFSIVNVEDVSSNEMGVSSMFNEKDETIYNQTTSDSQSTFAEQVNPENQQTTNQPNFTFGEQAYGNQEEKTHQSNDTFSGHNVKELKKKKVRKFFKKFSGLVAAAAVFGLVAGGCFQYVNQGGFQKNTVVESNQENSLETDNNDAASNGDVISTSTTKPTVTDVSTVVENVMPAIVAINSSSTQTEYDFFGRVYENEVSGSGSGIIIGQNDDEILIVTNNHVISGATAIEIVFNDDSKAIAKLKGAEPTSDLAVVAVDINDLSKETRSQIKIATLGDSDEVKTGELAIAIGNALGYGQSVTVGYISALNREVSLEDTTLNLLQTDAAINPGNSGGALLNASGEVIGINSVKYADTSVEGIGYAIPISDAIPIINDLMNREDLDESESAYLGIQAKTVDESYSQAFNMPIGVYVASVGEGTPAEVAGLHKGDIITNINGKDIKNSEQLQSFLSYTRAGTKVELKVSVLENGSYTEKTLEVTLGSRPSK